MDEKLSEHLSAMFKRMEVDVQLLKTNITSDPYLTFAAAADLKDCAKSIQLVGRVMTAFSNPEESFGTLDATEAADILVDRLKDALTANGVDLSHFTGNCKCIIL